MSKPASKILLTLKPMVDFEKKQVQLFLVVENKFYVTAERLVSIINSAANTAIVVDSKDKDGTVKKEKTLYKSEAGDVIAFALDGELLGKIDIETLKFIVEMMIQPEFEPVADTKRANLMKNMLARS